MTDFSDSPRPRTSALQAVNPTLQNDTSLQLALAIAQSADDRKGSNIQILPVGDVSYLADYFVLVTGFSAVQVRAIARNIQEDVETKLHRKPLRTEGQLESSWILQDYGEVIVHIFMPEERDFYDLEAFWGHAEPIDFATLAAASEAQ
ncbi:ribosome silencing factor [filamentous cyanobacterium CCP5]|nr:ribosome silencing factor [filamentous cyanobacterium CCP5]